MDQFQFITKPNFKMYAILKNNIVVDCWFAKTKEEAQQDNPNAMVIEITTKNSPVYRWQPYPYKIEEN